MGSETTTGAETARGAKPAERGEAHRASARRCATDPSAPAVYGICVVCHERTPLEELVARPATSLCRRCARKEQRAAVA